MPLETPEKMNSTTARLISRQKHISEKDEHVPNIVLGEFEHDD